MYHRSRCAQIAHSNGLPCVRLVDCAKGIGQACMLLTPFVSDGSMQSHVSGEPATIEQCHAEMYEHASQVTGRGPAPRPVMQQPAQTPIATQTSAFLSHSPVSSLPAATAVTLPSAPAPSYQDFESESEGSEFADSPGNTKSTLLACTYVMSRTRQNSIPTL